MAGQSTQICWCGDSFIHRAGQYFHTSGEDAAQRRKGIDHHLLGFEGQRLGELPGQLLGALGNGMLVPNIVVIHSGGDDMVPGGRRVVKEALFSAFTRLSRSLPGATIYWSEVLPRQVWGDNAPPGTVNKSVRKLNQEVRRLLAGSSSACH